MKPAENETCGLDEAGRGALAGPLVAAAVILTAPVSKITATAGIRMRDGKLLSPDQREIIYRALKSLHTVITFEIISSRSINNHGIGWANREIFRRLIKRIDARSYIVDGKQKLGVFRGKTGSVRCIVDADATVPSVMAAGIVAKVERDALMHSLHRQFPEYGWEHNSGYGTRDHIAALESLPMTRYHRRIFVTTALRNRSGI